jgi:hypothetical protein
MANNINWGKVYCEMTDNDAWGVAIQWSTNAINDLSAPLCWEPKRADSTLYTADSTIIFADNLT